MTTPGSVFGFFVGRRNRWWQREGDGGSGLGSGLGIWKFIPGKAWRVLAGCGTEATEPERHIAMSLLDQDVETKDSNPRWVDAHDSYVCRNRILQEWLDRHESQAD
jgi:hypothetical protein